MDSDSLFPNFFHRTFAVTLRFKRKTEFHFFHGGKLYGLLNRTLKQHPLGKEIVIIPCESGRIRYFPGDLYRFGVTILKDDPELVSRLSENLYAIPDSDYPGDLTNSTVEVAAFDDITGGVNAVEKSPGGIYELRFTSPLRHERPVPEQAKGKTFFDPDYFNPEHFFSLLFRRVESINRLNCPSAAQSIMPPLPALETLEKHFLWLDMPKDAGTLGGVQGIIKFKADLPETWLRALALGQITHAGKNTSFGFGSYLVNGSGQYYKALSPADTLLHSAFKGNPLAEFLDNKTNAPPSKQSATDTAASEKACANPVPAQTMERVFNGSYSPAEKTGSNNGGDSIPLEQARLNDEFIEMTAARFLSSILHRYIEESHFYFQSGYSNAGAKNAYARAEKEGYSFLCESDLRSFYHLVNREQLWQKLELMFGPDPLFDLIKRIIEAKIKDDSGLPEGTFLSRVLVKLMPAEISASLDGRYRFIRSGSKYMILQKEGAKPE